MSGEGRVGLSMAGAAFSYRGFDESDVGPVDLVVAPGQCVVVCGASGCGKTTVTRMANGLASRFYEGALDGMVRVGGASPATLSPEEAVARVGSVFQDPRSQFFTTDVTSEVAFACENSGMDRAEAVGRVADAARAAQVEALLGRSLFELSSGERQRVALASALACGPGLLVFDEPFANLDPRATVQMARLIAHFKAMGRAVLIAEHRLWCLRDVVDEAVVMERGRVAARLGTEELVRLDAERRRAWSLRSPFPEVLRPVSVRRAAGFEYVVEGLSFVRRRTGRGFAEVSFRAYGGEVIAVTGLNGAGKTTLASVLCGLTKQRCGSVTVRGRACTARARRALSSFVMQDADYQLFAESVAEELRIGADKRDLGDDGVARICDRLGLSGLEGRHPASLSGGQKQRVTIGAALAKGSDVVFLDEPTSGLDGESMARVGAAIRALADEGKLVFVITHDFELIVDCCTRALRLEEGRLVADVPIDDAGAAEVCRWFFPMSREGRADGGKLWEGGAA